MSKRPQEDDQSDLPQKVVVLPGGSSVHASVDLKLKASSASNLLLQGKVAQLQRKFDQLVTDGERKAAEARVAQRELETENKILRSRLELSEHAMSALNIELDSLMNHTPKVIDQLHDELDRLAKIIALIARTQYDRFAIEEATRYRERWITCAKELGALKKETGLPLAIQNLVDQAKRLAIEQPSDIPLRGVPTGTSITRGSDNDTASLGGHHPTESSVSVSPNLNSQSQSAGASTPAVVDRIEAQHSSPEATTNFGHPAASLARSPTSALQGAPATPTSPRSVPKTPKQARKHAPRPTVKQAAGNTSAPEGAGSSQTVPLTPKSAHKKSTPRSKNRKGASSNSDGKRKLKQSDATTSQNDTDGLQTSTGNDKQKVKQSDPITRQNGIDRPTTINTAGPVGTEEGVASSSTSAGPSSSKAKKGNRFFSWQLERADKKGLLEQTPEVNQDAPRSMRSQNKVAGDQ
ncbi:hypothetical protein AAF712_009335 [Marasmius tenuissimus]|uniref:Uncharacterized protein n=1 Tax=Marasmius tenuissimus TaxID=585030 RepID=A0ABR2ZQZ1_9AGAR